MRSFAGIVVLLVARTASAQSINVNFNSDASSSPASTYAAAGAAGTWNTISGLAGPTFSHFKALDGSTTGIGMTQSPTTTLLTMTETSVTGDDSKLLNSGLVTTGAETCLAFTGVAAGTYQVLVYAWEPDQPTILSRTRQDEAPSTIDVGGAWTGAHVEGVTYARYEVTVGADGMLPAHSGRTPTGASAAFNGIQIQLMSPASGDAGTDPGDGDHHGGCSTTNSTGLGAMSALMLLLGRRRSVNVRRTNRRCRP